MNVASFFFAGLALLIGVICFIEGSNVEGLLCTLIAAVLWSGLVMVKAVRELQDALAPEKSASKSAKRPSKLPLEP